MAVEQRLVASLTPDALELAAGGTSRVVVTVDNRGSIVDEFRLQVEGLDATWFDIRSPKVSLFPNEAGQLELDIHVPAEPVRAGIYRGVVRVVSGHDPLSVALLDLTITVPLIERLEMDLRPAQVTTSGSARYRVQLNNSGNSEQVVDLRVTDADQLLRSKLGRDRVSIPAGESIDVDVRVEPHKGRLLGRPAYHSFDITAVRADEPLSEPVAAAVGQLVYKPRLAF